MATDKHTMPTAPMMVRELTAPCAILTANSKHSNTRPQRMEAGYLVITLFMPVPT
jgi:hypothetical protein